MLQPGLYFGAWPASSDLVMLSSSIILTACRVAMPIELLLPEYVEETRFWSTNPDGFGAQYGAKIRWNWIHSSPPKLCRRESRL